MNGLFSQTNRLPSHAAVRCGGQGGENGAPGGGGVLLPLTKERTPGRAAGKSKVAVTISQPSSIRSALTNSDTVFSVVVKPSPIAVTLDMDELGGCSRAVLKRVEVAQGEADSRSVVGC